MLFFGLKKNLENIFFCVPEKKDLQVWNDTRVRKWSIFWGWTNPLMILLWCLTAPAPIHFFIWITMVRISWKNNLKCAVPEMFAWDWLELLSDGAIDRSLSSFLRGLQEHGEDRKQQRHCSRMTHQLWPHRPRVQRIHSHIWPWWNTSQTDFCCKTGFRMYYFFFHFRSMFETQQYSPWSLRASSRVKSTLANLLWQ